MKAISQLLGIDVSYFVKNNLYLSAATLANLASGFILSLLFARLLSPTVFGQYSLIYSIIATLGFTSLTGLKTLLPFALAKGNEGFYFQSLKLSFLGSLLGSLSLVGTAFYYLLPEKPPLSGALFMAAFFFPAMTSLALYPGVLTAKKQFATQGLFAGLQALIPNLVIALALVAKANLFWLVFVGLASQSILNLIFTRYSFNLVKNKRCENQDISYSLKLSLLWLIPTLAQHADKIILAKFIGFEGVAIYSFAILLPGQITNFLKNFQPLMVPKISQLSRSALKQLPHKSLLASLYTAPLVAVYILVAPLIIAVLYPQYQASILPSQIYSLSLLFFSSTILSQTFHHLRDIKVTASFSLIGSLVKIIILVILVPLFGVIGAAIYQVLVKLSEYLLAVILFKHKLSST